MGMELLPGGAAVGSVVELLFSGLWRSRRPEVELHCPRETSHAGIGHVHGSLASGRAEQCLPVEAFGFLECSRGRRFVEVGG